MKKLIYYSALFTFLFAWSCKQEVIELQTIHIPIPPPCPDGASPGTADFTKFVAIGSSYTAGFQAGALFDDGQNNSLPAILNKQFECVGAPATFNQPTIHSALGYNIFVTPNPDASNHIFGRFLLQYNGAISPLPTPQLSDVAALPNPSVNPAFIYGNGSTKAALNNFGVQAIVLGQALIPQTGAWAGAGVDPRFNPFYGRWAYPGTGTSTIIGDAAAAGGSFFMFWLGMDDFLLYAAYGGDPNKAPLTSSGAFAGQYGAAVGSLLGSNANLKGVVANFPDIFMMPHFTAVPWNAIEFVVGDQPIIDQINAGYKPYNDGLDAFFGGGLITAAERDKRKIHFVIGKNGSVIEDETLTDLSGYGLPSIRHATASDIFPLAAGSVLGTEATPGNPSTTWGVSKALTDQYALIPTEIAAIVAARTAFNATIKDYATANSTRLAFADVDAAFAGFVAAGGAVMNGVTIAPLINPPVGIYSEDGLHPNTRGYAFISNIFIAAINERFAATIPLTNISLYHATGLPIP